MPRLSRTEQQARTRSELLSAAERVLVRKGFHATSVEEIADEAGYSKGAVYSNFDNKDELFLAVLENRLDSAGLAVETTVDPSLPVADQARDAGEGFWKVFLGEPEWSLLLMEYAAHSVRNPVLRDRFAQRNRGIRAQMAQLIDEHLDRLGLRTLVPSDQMATILFSLGSGVILEKLTDPEGVRDDTFSVALQLLFAGIVTPR